jgi:hypothetical protein
VGLRYRMTDRRVLPPVIKDMKLIGDGYTRAFKIRERANNVVVFHVLRRIVVDADRDNASVLALSPLDQLVQVLEVIMVLRKENKALLDGVQQVSRIGDSGRSSGRWQNDVVAGFLQTGGESLLGNVIVQIDVHASGLKFSGA